jgi:hypothetical protein
MKKITSILSIMALTAVFSTSALAQQNATTTATSSATVITPISIVKNGDLNFGTFSTDGVAGSIQLAANAAATPTISTGIRVTTINPASAAKFTVSGEEDYAYTIQLPSTITLKGAATATNTMTIENFTTNLTSTVDEVTSKDNTAGLLTSGSEVVYVGGTLVVPASTVKDVYSNADALSVTVTYN